MKALLLVLCLACSTAHATTTATEVRAVGSFHGLSIETVVDVEVTIGPATRVEVSAPKDALAALDTHVKDGTLHIATPNAHGHLPKFTVTITTPSLDAIAISGVSKLHATRLAGKDLALQVGGAAEVELAGTTEQLAVAISGQAELRGKDFVAQTAAVQVSGACDGTLHVTKSLAAAISGTASLVVYGKPAITRAITGVGTIESR